MSIAERQQEEKAQRRRTIIDAAERVLQRKSIDDVTMSDVAKEARLSRSLLYVYFEDKDDIYMAVTRRSFRTLRQAFEAAHDNHDTGLLRIRGIGEAYIRLSHEHPVYFEAITRFEGRELDPEESESYERQCMAEGDRVFEIMCDAIQSGVEDGSIRADIGDPMQAAITLWAYTHGLIQVVANKASMLETHHGIAVGNLMEYGMDLANVALSGTSAHTEASGES